MVGLDLQRQQRLLIAASDLLHDGPGTIGQRTREHRAAVLGNPHNVVCRLIYGMPRCSYLEHIAMLHYVAPRIKG